MICKHNHIDHITCPLCKKERVEKYPSRPTVTECEHGIFIDADPCKDCNPIPPTTDNHPDNSTWVTTPQPKYSGECKDAINPDHYKWLKGIECSDVTENFNFNLGNAIKYIWRAGHKDAVLQELKKAEWYIKREIKRLEV